jgi:hypothetical protein
LFLSLLVGGFVKEKYLTNVQTVFASARQQVYSSLAPRFGDAASRRVIDAVIAGDRSHIRHCIRPLRRALLLRALYRRPAQTFFTIVRHYAGELRVRFSPSTTTDVAIASANEALAAGVIAALAPMLQPATVLLETRTFPAGARGSSAAGDSFRLLRCMVSGWIQKCTPKKHLTLRLHAHHCSDWPALQKGSNSLRSTGLAKLAHWLSPSPDLLVVLSATESASGPADAQVDGERPRCVLLDSSQSIAELAEQAYAAIITLLAERAEQRICRFA